MTDDDNNGSPGSQAEGAQSSPCNGEPVLSCFATDATITVDDITTDFEDQMRTWKSSVCRQTLLRVLEKHVVDEKGHRRLDKAVCLGLWGFTSQDAQHNSNMLLQLACFVDLAKKLCGAVDREGRLIAQDPGFNAVDEEFLESIGVTVVHVTSAPRRYETATGIAFVDDAGHSTDDSRALDFGEAKAHFGPTTFACEFHVPMDARMTREFVAIEHGLYLAGPWEGPIRSVAEAVEHESKYEKRWFPDYNEFAPHYLFSCLSVRFPRARKAQGKGAGSKRRWLNRLAKLWRC